MLRPASTRRFLKTTTAAIIAATLAFTLTACFGNPLEKIASGSVGKIVEQATGGQLEVGSEGSMPKDFPAEVPLVSTDVVTSFSMKVEDGKAWTIGVRAAGSLDQVSD
ncbi:hypothetical protein [Homoserinimonas sp. OAct 916]|uniref:hypothetical protein n=1 Tax=Homoserinimonas sp. OAct 916 TaxID=2211450 RepID=UPI000DBE3410|nr:hypothetical protein [Homoserinimonas sp. OAct 916]